MEIFDGKKPPTREQIEQLEIRYKGKLSREYLDFLLAHNGGWPVPDGFNYIDNKTGSEKHGMVDCFLGIHNEYDNNFYKYLETYKERMPIDLIPIANDPGGNLICLSLESGEIYFWDHDCEVEEGEVPDYQNLHFIADSFGVFLNNLTEFSR